MARKGVEGEKKIVLGAGRGGGVGGDKRDSQNGTVFTCRDQCSLTWPDTSRKRVDQNDNCVTLAAFQLKLPREARESMGEPEGFINAVEKQV